MRKTAESVIPDTTGDDHFRGQFGQLFRHIMPSFVNNAPASVHRPEGPTEVSIYEVDRPMTFAQMLAEISPDTAHGYFTEHQICEFVRLHRKWWCCSSVTMYYPFMLNGRMHIAAVYPISKGESFGLDVHMLSDATVWPAMQQQFVFPH